MAATNFTPIILYHTTTASAAPTAGNLNNGELAINITDGKLFYKDNGGTVQVIATKGTGTIGGSNTQVQYNSSGALAGSANFTFNGTTATINTLNLTNALGTAYGGTALTTYAQGDLVYASAANTLAKLGIGANTYILTSTGSVPQWSAPSAVTVSTANNLAGGAAGSVPYQSGAGVTTFLSIGTANQVLTSSGTAPQWSNLSSLGVSSLSFGTTGLTPSTATQGAITVAGTLATTNGGTGLTSFTANGVVYASSSSALATGSALSFDGTNLTNAGTGTFRSLVLNGVGTSQLSTTDASGLYIDANTTGGMYLQSGSNFIFRASAAGSYAEYMRVTPTSLYTASGINVGIGAVPTQKFEVYKAAGDTLVYGSNPRLVLTAPTGINGIRVNADTTPLELLHLSDGSQVSVGGNMDMTINAANATAGSTFKNSPTLAFLSKYWNGSASASQMQGFIGMVSTAATTTGGYFGLGIGSPGTITIDSANNVGVGLVGSSTYGKLAVAGTIAQWANVAIGAELGRIQWYNTGTNYDVASIRTFIGAGQVNRGEFGFYTNTGAGQALAMYISRTQYVGIGTGTSPSYNFDVNVSAPQTYAARIINTSGSYSTDSCLLLSTSTASDARIISAQNAGSEYFSVTGSGITTVGGAKGITASSLPLQVSAGMAFGGGSVGQYGFGTIRQNTASPYETIITANAYPANYGVNTGVRIMSGNSGGGGPVDLAYFRSDGVTGLSLASPSTWSISPVLQGPYGAASFGSSLGTTITGNTYYNSGWKYTANSVANLMLQDSSGTHFYYGSGGAVDSAVTFQEMFKVYSQGVIVDPQNVGSKYLTLDTSSGGDGHLLFNRAGLNKWQITSGATNSLQFYNYTAGSQSACIDSSGRFLVNTTNPQPLGSGFFGGRIVTENSGIVNGVYSVTTDNTTSYCYVAANNGTTGQALMSFHNYNGSTNPVVGSISHNGTTTTYATSSDYRLKDVTGPIANSGAYIDSLKPVEGTWKSNGSVFVGLLAHEAQEVSRTRVATGEKDGKDMQGMDYGNSEFIANIIAELQSLRKRVAQLEQGV